MKNKIIAVIIAVSLLLASIGMMTMRFEASAENENVKLYIDPPLVSKSPGQIDSFFDVYITIANVTDLFGFDFEITWDNALINFNSYDNTTLDAVWGAYGWSEAVRTISPGSFKLVALSISNSFTKDPGSQVLYSINFKIVKACNFVLETDIHFTTHKLSDSLWTPILHTVTDGHYYMDKTIPQLLFEFVDPTPSKPIEYCKTFQVKVKVTHICAQLKDYDFTILYTAELLKLTGVDWTGGVLGNTSDGASYSESTLGTISIVDIGGIIWSGDNGLLFTLTFHVEFDDRDSHIWRTTTAPNELPTSIAFSNAELSFVEGNIPMSGISTPPPVENAVRLIRGDVMCDGDVDLFDLRTVAYYYDQINAKYDLNVDNIIDIFDLVIIATNYGYPS